MCGICGQYNFGGGGPVQREDIEHMTATMVHRGPDDEGYFLSGPLGLGFRRLSIIDIEGGHQPMSDREKLALIFLPGFSMAEKVTDVSGRGVGMDVVKTNLDQLKGEIDIETQVVRGTRIRMTLPYNSTAVRCASRFPGDRW